MLKERRANRGRLGPVAAHNKGGRIIFFWKIGNMMQIAKKRNQNRRRAGHGRRSDQATTETDCSLFGARAKGTAS